MVWCYLDESGAVQGPFDEATLIEWNQEGMLPQELPLRPADSDAEAAFTPLRELLAPDGSALRLRAAAPPPPLGATAVAEPAAAVAAVADPAAAWCYLDEKQQEQGPFDEDTLLGWYDMGLLPRDLPMRPAGGGADAPYHPLHALISADGNELALPPPPGASP